MPKRKKVKVESHKRRKPGAIKKTVAVKGYTRSPPQRPPRKKYSVKSTRKRKKKPKKSLWDILFEE